MKTLRPAAAAALAELDARIAELVERGAVPPCGDRDVSWAFICDDRETRLLAARLCVACPVLETCRSTAAVLRPTAGVWAGEDREEAEGVTRGRRAS